jgi:hypothetical protein
MTLFGYIAIPIGAIVFFTSEKWLLRILVVSTLFSGTAIVNVDTGGEVTGIQPWILFGILWLLRQFVGMMASGEVPLNGKLARPTLYLVAFVSVAFFSLVMPLYIAGSLEIVSPILTDFSTTPLVFSMKNVTAMAYLIFGSLVSISLANTVLRRGSTDEFERIYLGAGAFIAGWGILQFLCGVIDLPFPTALFNSNLSHGVTGPNSTLEAIDLGRVTSVAVEPSILAQCLLSIAPLSFPAILGIGTVFSCRRDRQIAVLIIAALILTFSSLAYIGILMLVVFVAILGSYFGVMRGIRLFGYASVCVLALVTLIVGVYLTSDSAKSVLDIVLFSKASGYSGLERLKTMSLAASYFSEYPWLGVGWGSVTSHDLLFKLLANVGLVGTLCFVCLVTSVVRQGLRSGRCPSPEGALSSLVWMSSFVILVISCSLSESSYVFGHFWFVLGIAMAVGGLPRQANTLVSDSQ